MKPKKKSYLPEFNIYTNYYREQDYTIVSVSTTGIKKRDRICELAALRVRNNQIVDYFHHYINPEMPVSKSAHVYNDLEDEFLQKYPTLDKILPQFIDFIGKDRVVGWCVDFDVDKILRNGWKMGFEMLKIGKSTSYCDFMPSIKKHFGKYAYIMSLENAYALVILHKRPYYDDYEIPYKFECAMDQCYGIYDLYEELMRTYQDTYKKTRA